MEPLRFGILGFGQHASSVWPAFMESSFCKLQAIATESPEKHSLIKKTLPDCQVYSSYRSLLEDKTIDVVYVCLPNHLHVFWTEQALLTKKHVLCEKPLALTHSDALLIQETACAADRLVFEGFMYRFHPQHQMVKNLVTEQSIGTLQNIAVKYTYELHQSSNIRLRAEASGGALNDAGCYGIDLSHYLISEEAEVILGKWNVDPTYHVDRDVELKLRYDSNLQVTILAANNAARSNEYVITGKNGVIRVLSAFHTPRGKTTSIEIHVHGQAKKTLQIPPANHFALQFDAVAKAVNGDRNELSRFSDYRLNAKLLEQARIACKKMEPL